ncbi:MAG: serine--tRNA ligase, partial [Candidatus Woesearchaeota archaeon]
MIDINLIRNNPKLVEDNLKKRGDETKLELFYKIKELDEEWRNVKKELDSLRAKRNNLSNEISERKKRKESVDDLLNLA